MKLYSRDELKNSRIFFDQKMPRFMTILSLALIIIIVGLIISAYLIPKNYIVNANGSIEADDKLYITSLTNGTISEINKPEGSKVKKGEIILTLSSGAEGYQKDEIKKQIKKLNEKFAIYDKFQKSLNDMKNYMKNSGDEQEFYGKMEYYLFNLTSDNERMSQIASTLEQRKVDLSKAESKLKEIENYYISKYEKELGRKNKRLKVLQDELSYLISQNTEENILDMEIKSKQSEIDSLNIEIDDFKDTNNEELKQELDAKETEINSLKNEIKEFEQSLSSQRQSISIYSQLISDLGVARTQNEEKIRELESQANLSGVEDENLKIKANKDGYLHYLSPIKEGISVQALQEIAQIDDSKSSDLVAECYISAADISKININDSATISIQGVNQVKYGKLKGLVTKISNRTIINKSEEETQLLYPVTIKLMSENLTHDKNKEVKIDASMPIVAEIIYDKETYLEWILKQLNFKK